MNNHFVRETIIYSFIFCYSRRLWLVKTKQKKIVVKVLKIIVSYRWSKIGFDHKLKT